MDFLQERKLTLGVMASRMYDEAGEVRPWSAFLFQGQGISGINLDLPSVEDFQYGHKRSNKEEDKQTVGNDDCWGSGIEFSIVTLVFAFGCAFPCKYHPHTMDV